MAELLNHIKDSGGREKMKKIMLTGDRPTGRLHVGHYVDHCAAVLSFRIQGILTIFLL